MCLMKTIVHRFGRDFTNSDLLFRKNGKSEIAIDIKIVPSNNTKILSGRIEVFFTVVIFIICRL